MTIVSSSHAEYHPQQKTSAASVLSAATLPLTWMRRLRQRRELLSLLGQPDYLLKDVGLQRDEITREGLKPFWFA